MPTNDDIAPVRLLEENGTFSLVREEFDGWYGAFEDAGYEGGGRGWHGVADALIRLKAPLLKNEGPVRPGGEHVRGARYRP